MMVPEDDKLNEVEAKIQKAFGIDLAEWYCQVFHIGKDDVSRVKEVKPRAYREFIQFLEPFADKLLGKKKRKETTAK